jgi:hypothetical protein
MKLALALAEILGLMLGQIGKGALYGVGFWAAFKWVMGL